MPDLGGMETVIAMNMERFPTITLIQPWGSWVALGWKPIETRTHRMFKGLVGQRIYIHAGKAWDRNAIGAASQWLTLEQQHRTEEFKAVRGAIIAHAYVNHFRELGHSDGRNALIECEHTRRYGLFLIDVCPIAPVPAQGEQGIWYFPK